MLNAAFLYITIFFLSLSAKLFLSSNHIHRLLSQAGLSLRGPWSFFSVLTKEGGGVPAYKMSLRDDLPAPSTRD